MPVVGAGAALAFAERKLGLRFNPHGAYNFFIEIQGMVVAGFTEISGLQAKTGVEEVPEGGINNYVHKLPKVTTYSDLTLKYGVTDYDLIWGWYGDVMQGKIKRRNASIYMLDDSGIPSIWWNIYGAWPISWNGPSFDAKSTSVAVDTLVLSYKYLEKSLASRMFAAGKGIAGML